MTEDEFKEMVCGDSLTWADLEPYLIVEPCDCGEYYCEGWTTRYKGEPGGVHG